MWSFLTRKEFHSGADNNERRREPLSTFLAGQPLSTQVAGLCGKRAEGPLDTMDNDKSPATRQGSYLTEG
jgi:hypothetical protein